MSETRAAAARSRYRVLRLLRISAQTLFVLLFFFLFIKTDYTGSDHIEYAVNILFRLDPLLAVCTILAVRTVIALMLPALLVVLVTLLVGRAFCGWFCPLGGLLDATHRVAGRRTGTRPTYLPNGAKIVFVAVVVAAVLQFPLAGYVDPFSLLVRGLTQAVYPALHHLSVSFFTFTYRQAPEAVNLVTEPVYSFLQAAILPFTRKFFELALLSLFLLVFVFAAELFQRRFFCRNVCPLGALLGWLARLGIIRFSGGEEAACGSCRLCASVCRMGAIDDQRRIDAERCCLCLDCFVRCPRRFISFGTAAPASRGLGISLNRRQLLLAAGAGAVAVPVLGVRPLSARPNPGLIRPPGARGEEEFLQRCVRCAECIKVCIGNALQPCWLEAGIEGVFTPRLVARTGYCEFNCTLCGQVCPTGAIRRLDPAEKQTTRIGTAWFDKDRCLPYAKAIPCMVCEEHCPTPDKAIKFRATAAVDATNRVVEVKQPYVVDTLCIGCGICETKCPLPGASAVFVTSEGEARNPDNRLPEAGGSGGYGGYGG